MRWVVCKEMRLWIVLLVVACSHRVARPAPPPPPKADDTQSLVHDVNDLVAKGWTDAKVTPAPVASDEEYLRRVTLDLIGRVPTPDEATAFFADASPDKRTKLVDGLLTSSAFAEHQADRYVALLVGISDQREKIKEELRAWLVDAFEKHEGWDAMTHAILTATGSPEDHGEAVFLASHQFKGGTPEAAAAATARVFLGLQLQCAQCHDHPYDPRWKQDDFYGLVAYFARTRAKKEEIFDAPKGEQKMTRHKTGETVTVTPRFLGRDVAPQNGENRRETLARAIVSSDLFAKEAVNLTWAAMLGRGIVDPVDDLGAEHDDGHPPLLVKLADDFAAHGHDLRRLYRVIALSDAYQRSSTGGAGADLERVFARAPVRPLTPEQLFRSLLVATDLEAAAARKLDPDRIQKLVERNQKEYQFVFGDDEMASVDAFDGNVPQALLLFNGEATNRGVTAAPGSRLAQILDGTKDARGRIDALFLIAYARRATDAEAAKLLPRVQQNKTKKPWEDLFFALLSSTEFTTNH